jgi:hypothetical protein
MVDAGVHQAPLFHHLTATNGPHGLRHIFYIKPFKFTPCVSRVSRKQVKMGNCTKLFIITNFFDDSRKSRVSRGKHHTEPTYLGIHTYIHTNLAKYRYV